MFLPHIGGIETLTYDIAKGLSELNVSVKVLTSRFDKTLSKEELMDDIRIRRYKPMPYFGQFSFSPEFMGALDTDLDIVHFISCYPSFLNWYGVQFYKMKEIPRVYTTIWPIPLTFNLYRKPYIKRILGCFYDNVLLTMILSRVNAVVTLTSGEAKVYRKLLKDKIPVYVVPEAVELPRNLSSSLLNRVREDYNLHENEVTLGLFGRVVRYKRIDLAIKALRLVNKKLKAKLIVVGPINDEDYFRQIKSMVVTYGLKNRVIFTGKVSFEVRDALYSIIDLVVHTSEYEAFVRPALEGWRYKKPIASFNLSPASDFIEEEKGGVVTKRWGDYIELAKLIEEIIKRNIANELGENGHKALMKKYTKDKVALSYLHIYKKVLCT